MDEKQVKELIDELKKSWEETLEQIKKLMEEQKNG